jgi:hypothetical protein
VFPGWRLLETPETIVVRRFKVFAENALEKRAKRQWRVIVSSEASKASATLPGKVEKVIHPHPSSGEPEKAQIAVEGADHLYREIRVPNRLTDANGKKVKLKEGAEVEVKIEAEPMVTKTVPQHDDGANPTR